MTKLQVLIRMIPSHVLAPPAAEHLEAELELHSAQLTAGLTASAKFGIIPFGRIGTLDLSSCPPQNLLSGRTFSVFSCVCVCARVCVCLCVMVLCLACFARSTCRVSLLTVGAFLIFAESIIRL